MEYRKKIFYRKILSTTLIYGLLTSSILETTAKNAPNNPDPFEPYNRPIFEFNDVLDKVLIRPAALFYSNVAPKILTTRVDSFFSLWSYPLDIVNYAIQGKWDNSKQALLKFSVSIILTAGTSDAGEYINSPDYESTSTQKTLAHLGMKQGPYIVLPFMGHGSLRSIAARTLNFNAIPQFNKNSYSSLKTVDIINKRSKIIGVDEVLEETSLDYYSAIRTITLRIEEKLVKDTRNLPLRTNNIFDYSDSEDDDLNW